MSFTYTALVTITIVTFFGYIHGKVSFGRSVDSEKSQCSVDISNCMLCSSSRILKTSGCCFKHRDHYGSFQNQHSSLGSFHGLFTSYSYYFPHLAKLQTSNIMIVRQHQHGWHSSTARLHNASCIGRQSPPLNVHVYSIDKHQELFWALWFVWMGVAKWPEGVLNHLCKGIGLLPGMIVVWPIEKNFLKNFYCVFMTDWHYGYRI